MKIRSITCFFHPGGPTADRDLERMGRLAAEASRRFQDAGYEVQTTRAATTPFPALPELSEAAAVEFARRLEARCAEQGFAYLALGPADPLRPDSYRLIPAVIAATQNTFCTGIMATAETGVSLPAVRACGQIIADCAGITPDGFANLRFAALANTGPFVPFFPAAYSSGSGCAFALAIECADAAVDAFTRASTLEEGRANLLAMLERHGKRLDQISRELASAYKASYKGIDCSLAPCPEDGCSLAGAMARLGVPAVGRLGEVAAGAILADTLDRGRWTRTGFNGLMLPVLEDSVMARRTGGDDLSVKDLLLFSTVCGAGLDTVPLPGGSSAEQLSALLVDVAALAVRLGKPLTARLMPVPGKLAGEATSFDFGFFANGRVMALPAAPLSGLLAGEETFLLAPRKLRSG